MQKYLVSKNIHGTRIKLNTGSTRKPNNYIYDDTIDADAISENGHHQGIFIIINEQEIVFDNNHPQGMKKQEWLDNLQFHGKLFNNKQFVISEEKF